MTGIGINREAAISNSFPALLTGRYRRGRFYDHRRGQDRAERRAAADVRLDAGGPCAGVKRGA